jgi:undecaprenyl diphosphate synthase
MDGNGRWARTRGLPRSEGYRAGAEVVRRVVQAAPGLDVETLTLFALSADNWERPQSEVMMILRVLSEYLLAEANGYAQRGTRVTIVGRRDRLSHPLREAIEAAERATARGSNFHLRIAIDYSAREALFRAACRFYKATELTTDSFRKVLGEVNRDGARDVDLLIRTGGEQRLSDFLLWESAYAELYFTPRMWPEFTVADLETALAEFHRRSRRFGRLPEAAAG